MSRFIRWSLALLFVLSAGIAQSAELGQFHFWLPNNTFAFEANLTGFNSQGQDVAPDLNGRSLSADADQHRILLTVHLDPETDGLTAAQLRDAYLADFSAQPVYLANVKTHENGEIALLSYDLTGYEKVTGLNQANAFAWMVKDSTALFVHLSSVHARPDAEQVYDQVLSSLKIVDNYQPTSMDYLFFASWCYTREQYEHAADFYQHALDLEKQKPELSHTLWRVTVDNLGMSYAFIDDPEKARATFVYGITEDPEYPMFHYNLACYYAESKQLDSTIAELSKAYEFKANMISGEEFPDPWKDDSFKRYWNNKTFDRFMSKVTK